MRTLNFKAILFFFDTEVLPILSEYEGGKGLENTFRKVTAVLLWTEEVYTERSRDRGE